jgi:hypothetical protein
MANESQIYAKAIENEQLRNLVEKGHHPAYVFVPAKIQT